MAGHNALGLVAMKRERWRDAERHFRQALQLEPDNASALNNLGLALSRPGRNKEAVAYFASASRGDPHDDTARRNATVTAVASGAALAVFAGLQLFRPFLSDRAKDVPGWIAIPLSLVLIGASVAYLAVVLVRRARRVRDPRASNEMMAQLRRQWWLERRQKRRHDSRSA